MARAEGAYPQSFFLANDNYIEACLAALDKTINFSVSEIKQSNL
jgi:hypothetical protein